MDLQSRKINATFLNNLDACTLVKSLVSLPQVCVHSSELHNAEVPDTYASAFFLIWDSTGSEDPTKRSRNIHVVLTSSGLSVWMAELNLSGTTGPAPPFVQAWQQLFARPSRPLSPTHMPMNRQRTGEIQSYFDRLSPPPYRVFQPFERSSRNYSRLIANLPSQECKKPKIFCESCDWDHPDQHRQNDPTEPWHTHARTCASPHPKQCVNEHSFSYGQIHRRYYQTTH